MGKGLLSLSGIGMLLQLADMIMETRGGKKKKVESLPPPKESELHGYGDSIRGMLDTTGRKLSQTPVEKIVIPDTPRNSLTPEKRVKAIVAMIQEYEADPQIRAIALKTISKRNGRGEWKVAERDWAGEANEIFGMLRREVRYTRDVAHRDTYVSPLRTLAEYHSGDCDDFSILSGSLLRSIGFDVIVRIIQTNGNSSFNHVYLLVQIPQEGSAAEGFSGGNWVPFDPSMPFDMGWQAPKKIVLRHRDFKVPEGETKRKGKPQ